MAVVLAIPFTFGYPPEIALAFLLGLYCSAVYGGSISAILVNTPGTIDSDYRGLVNLIITNIGKEDFTIKRGMRLAQMTIQEVIRAELDETEELDETARAHGGFGHTGV